MGRLRGAALARTGPGGPGQLTAKRDHLATTPVNSAVDLGSLLDLECRKPIFKEAFMTEEQKKEVAVFRYGVIAE